MKSPKRIKSLGRRPRKDTSEIKPEFMRLILEIAREYGDDRGEIINDLIGYGLCRQYLFFEVLDFLESNGEYTPGAVVNADRLLEIFVDWMSVVDGFHTYYNDYDFYSVLTDLFGASGSGFMRCTFDDFKLTGWQLDSD
ncbi:MAG: hypothetical protein OXI38_14440 [Bacteroidota bacterium]|nr:hypothetical protein [Bacteroidota bacterium]